MTWIRSLCNRVNFQYSVSCIGISPVNCNKSCNPNSAPSALNLLHCKEKAEFSAAFTAGLMLLPLKLTGVDQWDQCKANAERLQPNMSTGEVCHAVKSHPLIAAPYLLIWSPNDGLHSLEQMVLRAPSHRETISDGKFRCGVGNTVTTCSHPSQPIVTCPLGR